MQIMLETKTIVVSTELKTAVSASVSEVLWTQFIVQQTW